MNLVSEILKENENRSKRFSDWDPLTGVGAPLKRKKLVIPDFEIPEMYVPVDMLKNGLVSQISKCGGIERFLKNKGYDLTEDNFERVRRDLCIVRSRYDFAFWAFVFVHIEPKAVYPGMFVYNDGTIPFKLNYPQRYLLEIMEINRIMQNPIRIIICKSRQWGGSTLVQIYIAWIQLVHKNAWNSNIIAQVKDTAKRIKGMYTTLIQNYPSWMLDLEDGIKLDITPYEGATSCFIVTQGNGQTKIPVNKNTITIGSYENPDATRGGNYSCVHYSETALWKKTLGKEPQDIIKAVSGGMLPLPYTLEVIESTPLGVGNYHEREYNKAKRGESNRTAVFIPWYMVDFDQMPFESDEEKKDFARTLLEYRDMETSPLGYVEKGKYFWRLWEMGATLEGLKWYMFKAKGIHDHSEIASEAPSDDVEAFQNSGDHVFDIYKIDQLRRSCRDPKFIGEVIGKDIDGKDALVSCNFIELDNGGLKVWKLPDKSSVTNRYIVVVDIGGVSTTADYSVITVIDRQPLMFGGCDEVVARWRGHIPHAKLAWKAAQIATFYDNALLVIESNTLETKDNNGDHSEFILNRIGSVYPNLYARSASKESSIAEAPAKMWGFHTNTSTKVLIIDNLIDVVDKLEFIERDDYALDEFNWYERKQNGGYGAIDGQHDDVLMTDAIGLWISRKMPFPKDEDDKNKYAAKKKIDRKKRVNNESNFM